MNTKEFLTDFFEARGRFDLGDRYLGMGGSEVPSLFAEALGELSADDQEQARRKEEWHEENRIRY